MQTIRFVLTGAVAGAAVLAADLPGTYYQRMGDGLDRVMTHLESAPQAGLRELESIESRIIYRQSKQREDCFQKAVIKRGLRRMRRSA